MITNEPCPESHFIGRAFAAIGLFGVPFVFGGASSVGRTYASFTQESKPDEIASAFVLLFLSVTPAILSTIRPHRTLVVFAAYALVPSVLLSLFLLVIPPLGLVVLTPHFLWYRYIYRPMKTDDEKSKVSDSGGYL